MSKHDAYSEPRDCDQPKGMMDLGNRDEEKANAIPSFGTAVGIVLHEAGKTFAERSLTYKDNYVLVGQVMAAVQDSLPKINTREKWELFHLFQLIIVKLTRFITSGFTHIDSIHDIAVYAAMIEVIIIHKKPFNNEK